MLLKNFISMILFIIILCSLTGCTNNETKDITTKCETFMSNLKAGNWSEVQNNMVLNGMTSDLPETDDGLLNAMLQRLTYKIDSIDELQKDTYIVKLKIDNIEFKELIESLPKDVASKKQARSKMVKLIEENDLTTYDAKLMFVKNTSANDYEVMLGNGFTNALTGGFHTYMEELMQEVLENE